MRRWRPNRPPPEKRSMEENMIQVATLRSVRPHPDFAPTEFMFNHGEASADDLEVGRRFGVPARPATRLAPSGGWPFMAVVPIGESAPAAPDAPAADDIDPVRWAARHEAAATAAAATAAARRSSRSAVTPAEAIWPMYPASTSVHFAPAPQTAWMGRVDAVLDALLPGGFGSLLGLFLCVSMSIVLLWAMLPLVDRA